jgi:hypothetical protein
MELDLPPSLSNSDLTSIETQGGGVVVVVVGANGSGKTRLGSWIEFESRYQENVHRVSAQRSLSIPSSIRPDSLSKARSLFLYGHESADKNVVSYKRGRRWGGKPSTTLLNDYQQLLIYLFAEEFQKSIDYRKAAQLSGCWSEPPQTKLDIIKHIWEAVLPNRELLIGSSEVEVKQRNGEGSYNAAEMSDGERVIFYLIGECLAAPEESVLVIDEPEIHLHKSIQARLWDTIEAQRPDCLFVYLTHDLDFAASRVSAPKVCLKEFDGKSWDWYVVPKDTPIPDEIMLQIVGSRKPILFVEGEQSSLDHFLYSHLYPNFTVVPCGSCSHVINSTRSFASLEDLHRLECRGIVDRDRRTDEEITYLQQIGISVLEVSEIENLLLNKEILLYIGFELGFGDDLAPIMDEVETKLFNYLEAAKRRLAASFATRVIESSLTSFDAKVTDRQQLEGSWKDFVESIDVENLYSDYLGYLEKILAERDYEKALQLYFCTF